MRTERDTSRGRCPALARPSRPRRLSGDTGAIMAEAALLTPFFMTLLFGMIEFGGAFRDYLTLSNATIAGARTASILATQVDADWYVIQSVKNAANAMPLNEIQAIVVYKATVNATSPASVSASCLTVGVSGVCNYYSGNDLTDTSEGTPGNNKWTNCTGSEASWCPSTRNYALTGPKSPPDYIGVWVKINHRWLTGLFGSQISMTNNTVTQIEPQKLSS